MSPTGANGRERCGPDAGNGAVWSLVLPPVERVLCHAETLPALLVELLRRGTRVDVVTRSDLETWKRSAPSVGRLRCLWEPDAEAEYDLALLWDPRSTSDVAAWLRQLAALRVPPRDIALWSRNPWAGAAAPPWPSTDALVRRAGWRLGEVHLALPEADRVRQLVAWQDYARTPLLQHRRTHRPWKAWVARQPFWRWRLPARLRRARFGRVTAAGSVLDAILADVARRTGNEVALERLLVSPNGVAIAGLGLRDVRGVHNAILKIPYTLAAEGRLARNATGLEWMAAHATRLGRWAEIAPRLIARGRVRAWSYTLEERAEGGDAQGWGPAAADEAMRELCGLLATLASLGEIARPLGPEALDRICGAPLRCAAGLSDRQVARRLHALGERLVASLEGVPVPLVPRHGDFKLENVLGEPRTPASLRVLDWELWTPRGLPLLDAWHLVASRRARDAGCSLGEAMQRWLFPGVLGPLDRELVAGIARGLDPRYVAVSPWLYWLDRIGPIVARGAWPAPGWDRANIAPVLDAVGELAVATR